MSLQNISIELNQYLELLFVSINLPFLTENILEQVPAPLPSLIFGFLFLFCPKFV